jgi:pilus assembly protein CpaE
MNSENHGQRKGSPDALARDFLPLAAIALDKETTAQLRAILESIPQARLNTEVGNYLAADSDTSILDRLRNLGADVLLIDFDRDRDLAVRTVQRLRETMRESDIFAVSSSSDSRLIIDAMRAGCNEYFVKPLKAAEFSEAFTRTLGRRKEKREITSGKVLAIVGVKGGSGVTSLSIHLSMLLAQGRPQQTLLVDFHRYLGDVALYLALPRHPYHFFHLVENASRLDSELLRGYRVRHASGVDVLTAPDTFEVVQNLPPGSVQSTLEFLQLQYRFVVVDCAPGLSDQNLEVISLAHHLYLVAQPEIPSLRNAARYMDELARLAYPQEKLQVVINRYDKRGPITEAEIEKAVHTKVAWKIPNDYREVTKTVNTGTPLSTQSRSDLAQSLKGWANSLTSDGLMEGKKEGKGMLGILRF